MEPHAIDSSATLPAPVSPYWRVGAKATDVILFTWLAGWLAGALVVWDIGPDAWDSAMNSSTTTSLEFFFFLFVVGTLLFLIGQTVSLRSWGATPGKLIWGLQVRTRKGARLGVWAALKRTLGEFLSLAPLGIGYFRTWCTAARTAWHDEFSGTWVVRAKQEPSPFGGAWSTRQFGAVTAVLMAVTGPAIQAVTPWAITQSQPEVTRYIWAGIRSNARGDYPGALKAYDKAIAADSGSSLAYANRGAVRGSMGDLTGQIADCTRALQLDSTQVWALLGRANANRLRARLTESNADYSRVIRLRPDWSGLVFAHLGRGANLFHEDRFDEAAYEFASGAQAANANYLGTSDFQKGTDFLSSIAECELFRSEALRRAGRAAEADSVSASTAELVSILGGEREQREVVRRWLSR